MTLRCRKGDMAIVLKGVNTGRFCTVNEYIGNGRLMLTSTGEVMECSDIWAISFGTETHCHNGLKWMCRDGYLLPIRPGDLNETEETEKKLEFSGR